MFNRIKLEKTNDYFVSYSQRKQKGVYFCRLNYYNNEIKEFLIRYFEQAKRKGILIQGKMTNPDERQLGYYEEIMGLSFQLEEEFFKKSLSRWMPTVRREIQQQLAQSMYALLVQMKTEGKNENIIKNAYIKFMCWLYYRFQRILNELGKEEIPKILYEGNISNYELKLFSILSHSGADILLLQYEGDQEYLKVDAKSSYSDLFPCRESSPFPKSFSIQVLKEELEKKNAQKELQIEPPKKQVAINNWLSGDCFTDIAKEPLSRGGNEQFYFTAFISIMGAEDTASYFSSLLRFKLKLETAKRVVFILEKMILVPDAVEVSKIKRGIYPTKEQLMIALSKNISFPKNKELEKLAVKAFLELLTEQKELLDYNKLLNRGVYLICWLYRYLPKLFPDWNIKVPVFIFYGCCQKEAEALFLRLLSRLPIDVLLLCSDLSKKQIVADKWLYEKTYSNSLPITAFPTNIEEVSFGTVAYQAERELDTVLYQDTGLYRNRQFKRAIPITLHTTYEEISLLWGQEAVYRPNFEVLEDRVIVPVLFSKVSGVPKGEVDTYWKEISKLITEDTYIIKKLPFLMQDSAAVFKNEQLTSFLKNKKLDVKKIKQHPSYPYGFIREDMQDYMLDKLITLLEKKLILGTFTNGTEFTILSTVLNLDKGLLRMIQRYDFTKKIPKLLIISTGEEMCSIYDSILTAYLNLIGFDIVLFTPTGYQSIERNFSKELLIEYQIGEYMYDLQVPRFASGTSSGQRESFIDKIFRRR